MVSRVVQGRRISGWASTAVAAAAVNNRPASWQSLALPGRCLPVRVHRPVREGGAGSADRAGALPLVLHVHGGGFVGPAVQSDWINSHLAARLPALVVSVEHRLLAPDTPLSAAADDGWDALDHLVRHAADWGIDPARIAVFGESCGALITALAAIHARQAGLHLRAQVLVNPLADLTGTMEDGHAAVTVGACFGSTVGAPSAELSEGFRSRGRDADGAGAGRGSARPFIVLSMSVPRAGAWSTKCRRWLPSNPPLVRMPGWSAANWCTLRSTPVASRSPRALRHPRGRRPPRRAAGRGSAPVVPVRRGAGTVRGCRRPPPPRGGRRPG